MTTEIRVMRSKIVLKFPMPCPSASCSVGAVGTSRTVADGAVASALLPFVGPVQDDEVVFVLVWGPVADAAAFDDAMGTPLDLDLELTFLADDANRCVVAAGVGDCGDATRYADARGAIAVPSAAAPAATRPAADRYGVEAIKLHETHDTTYTLWVRHGAAGDDGAQPVEATAPQIYVFTASGLVGTFYANPHACTATSAAGALADCAAQYDSPSFATPTEPLASGAARPVWSAPAANRLNAEYTRALCVATSVGDDGAVLGASIYESQKHFTAAGYNNAMLSTSCGLDECDVYGDAGVWRCSEVIENGIYACPGAYEHMLFCPTGTYCSNVNGPTDDVTDAATVRAAMCNVPILPLD